MGRFWNSSLEKAFRNNYLPRIKIERPFHFSYIFFANILLETILQSGYALKSIDII